MVFLPVLVAAALILGVAGGASSPAVLGWAAGAAAAAWGLMVWTWRAARTSAVLPVALGALALSGVIIGGLAMRQALAPTLVQALEAQGVLPAGGERGEGPIRLEGRLVADASPSARTVLLRVAVDRVWVGACGCPAPVEGQILASVGGAAAFEAQASWRAGRTVAFTATVRRPVTFRNLGAPDAAIELARRRAVLIASVKSAFAVEIVSPGSWLSESAAAIRARSRQAIARATSGAGDAAAVATAVLIGDRAGLDLALQDRLQRAGTFHVIAISGGNIALWSLAALWIAARLTRRRPLALALAALALVAYAAIVGGGASVMRATGMALVGIATQWLDHRGAAVNVLAMTAAVLVLIDPIVVFDVGFWLTTAATAGLVVGLPERAPGGSRAGALFRTLVLTSVWAEAALLPIVAAVFQQVTLAGILLSAVAIPAMAVVQLAALGAVVADVFAPVLLGACGLLLGVATGVVTESSRLVDVVPWLSWHVPPPSVFAVSVYYAAVAGWLWSRRAVAADTIRAAKLRRASAWAAPAGAVWIAVSPATLVPSAPGDLRVTAFDVGQGDAVLVHFPNGRRMLVDAGGAPGGGRDLGARVVGPALRARGIRRLDYLVVTHADGDHIGGAASIVREFAPAEVWTAIPVAGDAATGRLREVADAAGASWRQVLRGARLEVGGVQIAILHPPPADWERQRVRNDDSLVLAIDYGRVRVLLTGDIGAAAEDEVRQTLAGISHGAPWLTVLKVAHHGSAGGTGAAWLETIHPAIALVSAGTANPFGHPATAVLDRLRAIGAEVWRTDHDGEITVRTNGEVTEAVNIAGRRRLLAPQPR